MTVVNQYQSRAARVWFDIRADFDDFDIGAECLDAVDPHAGHVVAGWMEGTACQPTHSRDMQSAIVKVQTVETPASAPVESIKLGEYVKRKADAKKVYKRGAYDASTKRYSLEDTDDCSREIWVKKGTALFAGFTY